MNIRKIVCFTFLVGARLLAQQTHDFRADLQTFPAPIVYNLPGVCYLSQVIYYQPIRSTLICDLNDTWHQTGVLETKVANLPAATLFPGLIAKVTDGTSSTDCSTGLGTTVALCAAQSGTWISNFGGGGGSLPGGTGFVSVNAGSGATVVVSGDGTLNPITGALNVTQTNGSPFAPVATSGSASDLTTGTLPHPQLPTLFSSDIPTPIASSTTGTAAALTLNPTTCTPGVQAASGISANGNAVGCFTPSGGSSSVFNGSTSLNPTSATTMVISLADVSSKSPIRIEPTVLTANTSVSFSNLPTAGSFNLVWTQASSGGPFKVTYTGAVGGAICQITPATGAITTQMFQMNQAGNTVEGIGCGGTEVGVSRPATASGTPVTTVDSPNAVQIGSNNILSVYVNGQSGSNTVIPGTCTNGSIVSVSAAGVASCGTATTASTGGGTAQAQTATLSPAVTSYQDGLLVCWLPTAANTATNPTLAVNGLTATTIVKTGGNALVAKDLLATIKACAIYSTSATHWELQNPQTGYISGATNPAQAAGTMSGVTGYISPPAGNSAFVWQPQPYYNALGTIYTPALTDTLGVGGAISWWGDSWTNNFGLTSAANGFVNKVSGYIGWSATNYGVNGVTCPLLTTNVFNFNAAQMYVLELGVNDMRLNGPSVLPDYTACLMSYIIYRTAGTLQKGQSITLPTNWTAPTIYSNATLGIQTSTTSAPAVFTIPGDVVYVGTTYSQSATTTFTVTIDSVLQGTYTAASTGSYITSGTEPYTLRFPGLGRNVHTVSISMTGGSGPLQILFVASNYIPVGLSNTPSQNPKAYIMGVGRMTPGTSGVSGYANNGGSDYQVYQYNVAQQALSSTLAQDGFSIDYVDIGAYYDPNVSGNVQTDGLHPTDQGDTQISRALINAMSTSANPAERSVTRNLVSPFPLTQSGTSGTVSCSMGLQSVQKMATCLLNGYANTSTAQVYSFPTPFSATPVVQIAGGSCGIYNPTVTATTITLPSNAAMTAETCNMTVIGQ